MISHAGFLQKNCFPKDIHSKSLHEVFPFLKKVSFKKFKGGEGQNLCSSNFRIDLSPVQATHYLPVYDATRKKCCRDSNLEECELYPESQITIRKNLDPDRLLCENVGTNISFSQHTPVPRCISFENKI